MRLAETVTFGGSGLDRAAHLRADADAIARLAADPAAGVLLLWKGKPLFRGAGLAWLPAENPVAQRGTPSVFLGFDDGAPRFAADLSAWEPSERPDTLGAFHDPSEQTHPGLPDDHAFAELRNRMTDLTPREAELAATARGILTWHHTHGYCARCGAPSLPIQAGWQRECPSCTRRHFPRTDPVVIMLITRGNSVLLGRSPHWPERMYSLLAGFVEPGETVEAAVRREVFEETGVRVGEVEYLASQPWPFPASLMLGCRGTAVSTDIEVDPVEIESARWVTREELMDVFAGRRDDIAAAREGAIAQFLLSNWLADRLD
ncbi:NAD(+) diphosphatase [Tranquillimonas rosea]|uniref:NAD(+) diphosphatase n=1 Tax=Tranquillimonas rosea TaxID=641238 RepID=UPI003BAC24AB